MDRVFDKDRTDVDDIVTKVDSLMKRRSDLTNHEYHLNNVAVNLGTNFDRNEFRKRFITPLEKEVTALLKKIFE